MKIEWNKKYNTIAAYALIVIFIGLVFFNLITNSSTVKIKLDGFLKVLEPFFIGFIMAYLFNFILKFYEKHIFKKDKYKQRGSKEFKRKRSISMILTYITVIVLVYIFYNFVFPQIISSVVGIANNIPGYIEETSRVLEKAISKFSLGNKYSDIVVEKWDELLNYGINFLTGLLPRFANLIKSTLSSIWNIIIGLIVSIYILSDKEKVFGLSKKLTIGLFSEKTADRIIELTRRTNLIFSKFLGGKILDSLIIGVLNFILMKIFRIPFAILVSFIVGVTNIIPFFGPFIGAVPSAIIIFFEAPIKSLTFIILIIFLQQLDGNIIGPKILGDSLGISAFWILFALLITGKLLGLIGLIIGVPLFALIYSIIRDILNKKLRDKGRDEDLENYIDI